MKTLTAKQQRVLDVIRDERARTGRSPAIREIGRRIGVTSTCTVFRHLEALERKGYVEKTGPYRYHSIRLTEKAGDAAACCPTCGRDWPDGRAAA